MGACSHGRFGGNCTPPLRNANSETEEHEWDYALTIPSDCQEENGRWTEGRMAPVGGGGGGTFEENSLLGPPQPWRFHDLARSSGAPLDRQSWACCPSRCLRPACVRRVVWLDWGRAKTGPDPPFTGACVQVERREENALLRSTWKPTLGSELLPRAPVTFYFYFFSLLAFFPNSSICRLRTLEA